MAINRREILRGSGAAALAALPGVAAARAPRAPAGWDREVDVVVVGAGASGFPAAIVAREAGRSVLLLEAQPHIGGHAICSGGHVPLGGETSRQRKYGIADSPDQVFRDLTDWSVIEPNGFPDYRFNDREIIRAFADHCTETFEWLVAHGVVFLDQPPDGLAGLSTGNSAPRENHAAVMNWPSVKTGAPVDGARRATTSSGEGLIRPLEAAARRAGVEILLQHRLASVIRENGQTGPVVGVTVENEGHHLRIRARGVVLATGGSSSNVNFRRMFDPRLTEEYCGVAGEPYSEQDASGELAAMAVGASLWGSYNQTGEFGIPLSKPRQIGCRYGYEHLKWLPGSPVFARARASGLSVKDWQDLVMVNMLGERFYDETGDQFTGNDYGVINPYVQGSYRNAKEIVFNPHNWLDAALAGIGDGHNGGGPIWAVFDADAVAREEWRPEPPNVDTAEGFFFQADSLADLAQAVTMPHQRVPMAPARLEATIARYNGFVDKGVDADFGKPRPRFKIARPPFYAAWATPIVHDTRVGLRIDGKGQVIDMAGRVIPGLYSCGETAGGFSQHGLGRATCQGYIAGKSAAAASG